MISPQTTPPSSCRQHAQRLTRDQRIQVKTLVNEGYSRRKISQRLGLSHRQVSYTVENPDISPKKSSGQPPVHSTSQVDGIEAFARSSPEN
ncbi:hypothetical protein K3495_g10147 [Podosphaera aphanis]|nr:hypothetical protein K3495_g10147 [Podosphaera aphanis]